MSQLIKKCNIHVGKVIGHTCNKPTCVILVTLLMPIYLVLPTTNANTYLA